MSMQVKESLGLWGEANELQKKHMIPFNWRIYVYAGERVYCSIDRQLNIVVVTKKKTQS